MRQLFIYPQWNYKKAEEYLESMEKQGWILRKISYSYFFYFERKKSPPRSVKYLYTYTATHDVGMSPLEDHFKNIYYANSVSCGKYTSEKFYRVVDIQEDIKPMREVQNTYLKRIYFVRLLCSLFFLLPCVAAWLTDDVNAVLSAMLNVLGVGSGIYMLNCIIALVFLSRTD